MAKPIEIRRPRMDDRQLLDVMLALWGYPAVLVSNKLKLFDLLAEKPLTLQEVCNAKGLARRPAQALLSVWSSDTSTNCYSLKRSRATESLTMEP